MTAALSTQATATRLALLACWLCASCHAKSEFGASPRELGRGLPER